MKIKMTNAAIIDALQTINKFGDVTGKLAYAMSRTKNSMLREIKPFEEVRDNLIRKYGKESEAGISIEPNTDNYRNFINEIMPISQIAVDVDVYQISQDEFNRCDYYGDNISLKDYDIIELMFVEKPVVEEPVVDKEENKESEDSAD